MIVIVIRRSWDLEPVGCGDKLYNTTSVIRIQDTYPGAPRFVRFPTDQSEFMSAWERIRVLPIAYFLAYMGPLDNNKRMWAVFLQNPAFSSHFVILGHNSGD